MTTKLMTETLRRAQLKALSACLEEALSRFQPERIALYRYSGIGEPGLEKTSGFSDPENQVNWDLLLQCCHERTRLVQEQGKTKIIIFPIFMAGSDTLMALLYCHVTTDNPSFRSGELVSIEALLQRASAELALARKRLLVEKERVLPAPNEVDTWSGIRRAGLEAWKADVSDMALSFLQRARDMALEWGPCPELATSLNDYGEVLRASDRLEEAQQQFERGISVLEQAGLDKEPRAVALLNNFAGTLYSERELEEAEVFYRRALDIMMSGNGSESKATPAILSNLGVLSIELGDHASAQVWLQQALDSAAKLFGKDHPNTIRCLQKLEALRAS